MSYGIDDKPNLPPGVTQAEYDAQTRVPAVLIGTITPFLVATIFVVARFWSRRILKGKWLQDDIWVFISWVGSIAHTVLNSSMTLHGTGRHSSVQTESGVKWLLIINYISRIVFQLTLTATKLAILTLYLRVFTDPRSQLLVYGMIVFAALYTIPGVFLLIFSCHPISDSWNPRRFSNTCLALCVQTFMSGACSMILDLIMIVFAVPRVFPLKLPKTQKALLIIVVSLSSLVVISAAIRLVEMTAIVASKDITWEVNVAMTWSSMEVNVGIFCASAPAIKPAIRFIREALGFSSTPTASQTPRFRSSRTRDIELGNNELDNNELESDELDNNGAFNATPALPPANSRSWTTKRKGTTKLNLNDGDSSKGVLDANQLESPPKTGQCQSEAETDGDITERKVQEGGGTFFL